VKQEKWGWWKWNTARRTRCQSHMKVTSAKVV
jgi:hypothetical protein